MLTVNMSKRPLTVDDKALIRALRLEKGWGSRRMIKEFPLRQWKRSTLDDLITKIDETGDTKRKQGSGRPRSARTAENVATVEELILSQEGQPGTSKSPREIERDTGISRGTVQRIVKRDLQLKTFRRREVQLLSIGDRLKRLAACKRLKKRITVAKLARTWFTDEKIFTVQTPTNSQNDRVYASVAVKRDVPAERLLKGRKHFSQSVMVSVAVSKLGKTSLVFVERGAKVDSSYYCDIVLQQGLLPDIKNLSGDNFTFQQDGAPAHRSRKTVAYLRGHVPDFIEPENWPPNSPDLNPVDYSIWGVLQQVVYKQGIRDVEHLKEGVTRCWEEMSQDTINRAIGQFRKRLSLVIAANGGHIEHHFD